MWSAEMAQAPTLISSKISINGRLEGQEDLTLEGQLNGSILLEGHLQVEKEARVEADVEVRSIEIHGILQGKVQAKEFIELSPTAQVMADLFAPRVIVHEGALFRGLIDMGDLEVELPNAQKTNRGRGRRAPSRRPPPRRERTNAPEKRPKVEQKQASPELKEPRLPAEAASKQVQVKS